jgi:hypothetical protein
LNFKVIPMGSDGPVVAPFFFLSPSRFIVDSFKGSKNQTKSYHQWQPKSKIFPFGGLKSLINLETA